MFYFQKLPCGNVTK